MLYTLIDYEQEGNLYELWKQWLLVLIHLHLNRFACDVIKSNGVFCTANRSIILVDINSQKQIQHGYCKSIPLDRSRIDWNSWVLQYKQGGAYMNYYGSCIIVNWTVCIRVARTSWCLWQKNGVWCLDVTKEFGDFHAAAAKFYKRILVADPKKRPTTIDLMNEKAWWLIKTDDLYLRLMVSKWHWRFIQDDRTSSLFIEFTPHIDGTLCNKLGYIHLGLLCLCISLYYHYYSIIK
jgi:hypothetical protein